MYAPSKVQKNSSFDVLVHELDRLNEDVVRLTLRPGAGNTMSYRSGQFLSVLLPDGDSRCYSMASPYRKDGLIELHVRLQPGGKFSGLLANTLKPGDCLRVAGPFGACVLQPAVSPSSSIVMLATGTGIAPVKAMIEQGLAAGHHSPVTLYWGGRCRHDLYISQYFADIERRCSHFKFIPVLAEADEGWPGRRGFIQEAVARDFPNLSDSLVYACGAPIMVESARRLLVETRALPPENFHADAFTPPTPVAAGQPHTSASVVRITAALSDGTVAECRAAAGVTLLAALTGAGLPARGICGEKKSCGTCRVEVEASWHRRLSPPDRIEARLLSSLDMPTPSDRLACQIVLRPTLDGLRVSIPAERF